MVRRDMFRARERALEETYFHARDDRLLRGLRARAGFGELAEALKEKLAIDDPALLGRIRDLGLTSQTGAALLVAPLAQVAWAEGVVTDRERASVLELAASRGIEPGSPAAAQVGAWLDERPPEALFDVALESIHAGLSVLPPDERDESVRRAIEACRHVAMASGGFLALFGYAGQISRREARLIERIASALRSSARPWGV
jgi:hypothetical protein